MLAVMRIAIKSSELASRVIFFFIRCRSRLFLRSLRYHLASVSSTALQERFVFTTKINIIIEKRKKSTRKIKERIQKKQGREAQEKTMTGILSANGTRRGDERSLTYTASRRKVIWWKPSSYFPAICCILPTSV